MALKISKEHYELLKTEFNKIHSAIVYKDYQDKGLSDVRYMWDMFWNMKLNICIIDDMYSYMDDAHVNRALIKILKEVNV